MRASIVLVTLALTLAGRAAVAQTPAAPELIVNTFTLLRQGAPSIAMDALGRFVVVWESDTQDGSSTGVIGHRFDAAGARVGGEFIVNVTTLGAQVTPDVAMDSKGDFVVVWGDPEIKARRFSRHGAPLGGELQVNTYTTGIQGLPAVATDPAGNFVVVWQSTGPDGDGSGIVGRRFDAGGTALGGEFLVNTYTTLDQRRPDVVFTADNGFVVVFDGPDAFANGIWARLYDPAGNAVGPEFNANTALVLQNGPAVAAVRPSGFVVAWTAYAQDGSHNGIYLRTFDAAGGPQTPEIRANTYTTNAQSFPAVAADGVGGFVVTWESILQDGSNAGIYAQRFLASGAPIGAEFAVNTFTSYHQAESTVAVDSAGNFVVAWSSVLQDASDSAVVDRRFQGIVPTALAVDTLGNGVLEPAENARVQPSWLNATTAVQTFNGVLTSFLGPPPATHTITDPAAGYGATPAGAVHSCSDGADCYAVTINASGRPVTHWDASALEMLGGAPAATALQKRWTLHVGDSFVDVPRTNPFYRFIETLLHHSITGGCAGTTYCPSAATTREQMAVFVLVAYEGPGYLPRACGTPVFADVPATSPYCRWIEELFRRAVVGGCGGGNYCSSSPVSREQMAVFVLSTLDPALSPPPCTTPMYNDVPASSGFCKWIEELTRRGVVSGCGGGSYCPGASVTREQMGVFIGVTFGLSLYGP